MRIAESDDWSNAGPLYDGHLERSLEAMTIEDRLRWLDEGARMLAWARRVRIESGLEPPDGSVDWVLPSKRRD